VKVGQACQETGKRLAQAGIPEAALEASLLLRHVLGCTRAQLVLREAEELTAEEAAVLAALLARRRKREPLAYILGEQEFWSLSFKVSADVLIPRPESEELLERAFAVIRDTGLPAGPLLDLGAGSGALMVVLAKELPDRLVVGVDRSLAALRLAGENSRRHGVRERCLLLNADWLTALREERRFALVVANPPYVSTAALSSLAPEVRDYEPRLALAAGADGLDALRVLARRIPAVLQPGGPCFLEIGWDQGEAALEIFDGHGAYEDLRVHADLAGCPRILEARCR
jgi:release factor glutamine methyltransferase